MPDGGVKTLGTTQRALGNWLNCRPEGLVETGAENLDGLGKFIRVFRVPSLPSGREGLVWCIATPDGCNHRFKAVAKEFSFLPPAGGRVRAFYAISYDDLKKEIGR